MDMEEIRQDPHFKMFIQAATAIVKERLERQAKHAEAVEVAARAEDT